MSANRKVAKASVWIVWSPDGDLENVRTLAYNGGNGDARVYDRDNYDSRVGLDADGSPIPYFRHAREVLAFLCANPGKQCQADIRTGIFS